MDADDYTEIEEISENITYTSTGVQDTGEVCSRTEGTCDIRFISNSPYDRALEMVKAGNSEKLQRFCETDLRKFKYNNEVKLLKEAILHSQLECIDILLKAGIKADDMLRFAALKGKFTSLKFLYHHPKKPRHVNIIELCESAAEGGCLECLKFALSKDSMLYSRFKFDESSSLDYNRETNSLNRGLILAEARPSCDFSEETYIRTFVYPNQNSLYQSLACCAAKGGSLQCLSYIYKLFNLDYKYNQLYRYNRELSSQTRLDVDLKSQEDLAEASLDVSVSLAAARNGNLKCLEFAVEHGAPLFGEFSDNFWNTSHFVTACEEAAYAGSLECLRFANINGCILTDNVIKNCVRHANSLECLKYALQHGFPFSDTAIKELKLWTSFKTTCPEGQDWDDRLQMVLLFFDHIRTNELSKLRFFNVICEKSVETWWPSLIMQIPVDHEFWFACSEYVQNSKTPIIDKAILLMIDKHNCHREQVRNTVYNALCESNMYTDLIKYCVIRYV